MPAVHFTIKPIVDLSSRSNHDKQVMPHDIVKRIVSTAFSEPTTECTFAFRGEEPLRAGLPFYEAFMDMESRYVHRQVTVRHIIRTQQWSFDRAWIAFLSKHQFRMELVVDGQSHGSIGAVSEMLRRHGIDLTLLVVICPKTIRHAARIYQRFQKNNWGSMGFLSLMPKSDGLHMPRQEDYAAFLKTMFDLWYRDMYRGHRVHIQYFSDLLLILAGRQPRHCSLQHACPQRYVVDGNGNVYPCDFYMADRYCLGNLGVNSFGEIEIANGHIGFIEDSCKRSSECTLCTWYWLCRGGCRREREAGGNLLNCSIYCEAYQQFLTYAYERLLPLAKWWL